MMQHAIKLEWRTDDPTQQVKKIKPKSKNGFRCWTDAEVRQFEAAHPVGTRARLAMALGLFLGQARQDWIAMGPQHLGLDEETGGEVLNWVRLKTEDSTGLELAISVHIGLRRIIDATPSGHLTFLVNEYDKLFTADGFGGWFRNKCNEAGLPHCSFHGLRKAAATRLADAGCNAMEIASITGHASLREVQRYTETRDRKKAARCGS
jgi:integrase